MAAAIVGIATPSSSATCAVHLPVPFWPALSWTTSTSGWPRVGIHRRGSTCAVISTRNDSSGPWFQLVEHVADRRRRQAEAAVQHVVRLGDELHVAVLDAVVHHLDEVARRRRGPRASRRRPASVFAAIASSTSRIARPRLVGAARHQRRAEPRALLAARHAAADEVQARRAQRRLAAPRVLEEPGVAAVDHDVAAARAAASACSIIWSTGAPAVIIIMIRRGRSSAATSSARSSRR